MLITPAQSGLLSTARGPQSQLFSVSLYACSVPLSPDPPQKRTPPVPPKTFTEPCCGTWTHTEELKSRPRHTPISGGGHRHLTGHRPQSVPRYNILNGQGHRGSILHPPVVRSNLTHML